MTDFAAQVKYDILPYVNGEGLDIGCGDCRPHDFLVGVDIKAGLTRALTLDAIVQAHGQIVTKVIKTIFAVGSIGNICKICLPAFHQSQMILIFVGRSL